MELVRIDRSGRLYLSEKLRKKAGIKGEAVFEATVSQEGTIILKPKRTSVADEGRGIFKLSRSIKDVDKVIEKVSLEQFAGDIT